MDLDVRTVAFLAALASGLLGLGMTVAAFARPGGPGGLAAWGGACGVQGIAWVLLALRGRVPDLLSIALANALIVFACALYLRAVREFLGRPVRAISICTLPAATFVALLPFTYTAPNVAVRLVIASAATAALTAACGADLLTGEAPKSAWRRLTGIGFLTVAATVVARAGYLLTVDPDRAVAFGTDPLQGALYASNCAAVVGLSFGFVLMRAERATEELARLAAVDPLTGVLNRAGIEAECRREAARADRYGRPLAVLLVDLDRFKAINDGRGHAAGDAALKAAAAAIREAVRSCDAVGRYGGEEFLVLLPDAAAAEAAAAAERVRRAVETAEVPVPETDAGPLRLTTSIGAAAYSGDLAVAVARADAALYRAKAEGRNRVVVAD